MFKSYKNILKEFKSYSYDDGSSSQSKEKIGSISSNNKYQDLNSLENKDVKSKLSQHKIDSLVNKSENSKITLYAIRNVDSSSNEKRGLYDDAFIIVDKTKTNSKYHIFPGNTDPSKYGESNLVKDKGYPVIVPGTYYYKPGIHNSPRNGSYEAFIQNSDVTVKRDPVNGGQSKVEKGKFGINLHKGGRNRNEFHNDVSSSGCMTVPSEHWENFKSLLNDNLKSANQNEFKLVVLKSTDL